MIFPVHTSDLLQDFLAQKMPLSRTAVKRLLDNKKVFVNKQRVWIAGFRLKKGDLVEVIDQATGQKKSKSVKTVPVVYEDDYYLVANKPVGLLTNGPDSLETVLKKQLNNNKLTAVHRLDKDTSGLVIFAKTQDYFEAMKKVFQENKIVKIYRVLAQGRVWEKEFTVSKPIDGQSAVSHFRVLAANDQASYLEVRIETGRTHQIRIHLAGEGYPVVGENKYMVRAVDNTLLRTAPHQMLHAYRVEFEHPFLKRRVIVTEQENVNFRELLTKLRLK